MDVSTGSFLGEVYRPRAVLVVMVRDLRTLPTRPPERSRAKTAENEGREVILRRTHGKGHKMCSFLRYLSAKPLLPGDEQRYATATKPLPDLQDDEF